MQKKKRLSVKGPPALSPMTIGKSASVAKRKAKRFNLYGEEKQEEMQTCWLGVGPNEPDVILSYNAEKMTTFGWLLISNGTILDVPYTWFQLSLVLMLALATAAVLFLTVGDALRDFETDNVEGVMKFANGLLSFVLGMYVSFGLQRWWAMRTDGVGALIAAVENISFMLSVHVPANTAEVLERKNTILRYGACSLALLFQQASQDPSPDVDSLVTQDLLTPEELATIKACPNAAQLCWLWIASYLNKLHAEGYIPAGYNLHKLHKFCLEARQSVQTVTTYINVQLPLPYVHTIVVVTKMTLIITSIQAGVVIAVALKLKDYAAIGGQLVLITMVPVIYQGLIDLVEKIRNPFGGDEIDFPMFKYQIGLINNCVTYQEGIAKPPSWPPTSSTMTSAKPSSGQEDEGFEPVKMANEDLSLSNSNHHGAENQLSSDVDQLKQEVARLSAHLLAKDSQFAAVQEQLTGDQQYLHDLRQALEDNDKFLQTQLAKKDQELDSSMKAIQLALELRIGGLAQQLNLSHGQAEQLSAAVKYEMNARTRLLGFTEPSDSEYRSYAVQPTEQSVGVEVQRENNQGFFSAFRTSLSSDARSKNAAPGWNGPDSPSRAKLISNGASSPQYQMGRTYQNVIFQDGRL